MLYQHTAKHEQPPKTQLKFNINKIFSQLTFTPFFYSNQILKKQTNKQEKSKASRSSSYLQQ